MKNETCRFYPGCPPCFGLCNTEHAPYNMDNNKSCDGCKMCRLERAKGNRLLEVEGEERMPINSNIPCKTCNHCKIDDVHKAGMLNENGQPGCFGMHTFPFACDDGGREACPHCKKRQIEIPG